jgi:hypothetical protein
MNHSPTPWTLESGQKVSNGVVINRWFAVHDADRSLILYQSLGYDDIDNGTDIMVREQFEFIVQSVNAIPDLVLAIKTMKDYMPWNPRGVSTDSGIATEQKVRFALEKAGVTLDEYKPICKTVELTCACGHSWKVSVSDYKTEPCPKCGKIQCCTVKELWNNE